MKHVTIIPSDGHVYIDGVSRAVDLSAIDPDIHAVQWSEVNQSGEIEFVHDAFGLPAQRRPNQPIASLAPYQQYVTAWNAAAAKPES